MKRQSAHGSIHHIAPRSRSSEGYNVNIKQNQIELDTKLHVDFHRLFLNMLPHEQLDLWLDINRQVIAMETRRKLEQIVDLPKEEFYEESLWQTIKKRIRRMAFPSDQERLFV